MFNLKDTPKDRETIEGDKKAIDELISGLDKTQLSDFKRYAISIMKEQKVLESLFPILYRNAYKYICARRRFRNEVEAMTGKRIHGCYICSETKKWVRLNNHID